MEKLKKNLGNLENLEKDLSKQRVVIGPPDITEPTPISQNFIYRKPFKYQIPIVASTPFPNLRYTDENGEIVETARKPTAEDIARLLDCGFNSAIFTGINNYVSNPVSGLAWNYFDLLFNSIDQINSDTNSEYYNKVDFKIIISLAMCTNHELNLGHDETLSPYSDENVSMRNRELLQNYAKNSKVAGYIVSDEPKYESWNLDYAEGTLIEDLKYIQKEPQRDDFPEGIVGDIEYYQEIAKYAAKTMEVNKWLETWTNVLMYYDNAITILKELYNPSISPAANNTYPNSSVGTMVFNNLAASTDPQYIDNQPSYYDYLKRYDEVFAPPFFSFDYYPIITKVSDAGVKITYSQNAEFFNYLEQFRRISQEVGRPFWSFVESMQYTAYNDNHEFNYSRPFPTEGMLRFQAFAALAYGAQGIMYWTYGMRSSYGNEQYENAAIDLDNQKTPIWDNIRAVNEEIKSNSLVFLESEAREIQIVGIEGRDSVSTSYMPQSRVRVINWMGIEKVHFYGPGVLMSHIKNGSHAYIVIVNQSPFSVQTIGLSYESGVTPYPSIGKGGLSSQETSIVETEDTVKYTLAEGGYVILRLY